MAEAASEPSWLTGLDFVITDAPAGGGAAPGGGAVPNGGPPPGGRFSLSREEAQSMLTVAQRVRDSLQMMNRTAQGLLQVRPPTDDPGSAGYNQLLVGNGGGGAFNKGAEQVNRELTYSIQLVKKLQDALGITVAADAASANAVKNAASGNQSEGLA